MDMVPMHVEGVAAVPPAPAPVMLLREDAGERRWLAIAIGVPEAEALLAAQQHLTHPRPTTTELIDTVIDALGHRVERIEVTGLDDGVFLADLVLDDEIRVSARPSDAIALALRSRAPVEVAEEVLAVAAIEEPIFEGRGARDNEPADDLSEEEIAEFRDQLDTVKPEDFGKPGDQKS